MTPLEQEEVFADLVAPDYFKTNATRCPLGSDISFGRSRHLLAVDNPAPASIHEEDNLVDKCELVMLSLPSRCKLTTFSSAPKVRTARAQFAGSLEDCHKHCGVQEGVGQTSRLYGAPVGHPYWSPDHDLRTSLCSSARQARGT